MIGMMGGLKIGYWSSGVMEKKKPVFQYSITPILQYSTAAFSHYSNTPLFQYSIYFYPEVL